MLQAIKELIPLELNYMMISCGRLDFYDFPLAHICKTMVRKSPVQPQMSTFSFTHKTFCQIADQRFQQILSNSVQ